MANKNILLDFTESELETIDRLRILVGGFPKQDSRSKSNRPAMSRRTLLILSLYFYESELLKGNQAIELTADQIERFDAFKKSVSRENSSPINPNQLSIF